MKRSLIVTGSILALLIILGAVSARAQDEYGPIEGYIIEDTDGDGLCDDTGEPGVSGIAVEVININDSIVLNATSDSEGYFAADSLSVGLWQVTVIPGDGWILTSGQTVEVDINEDESEFDGIVFCLEREQVSASPTTTGSIAGFVYNDQNADGICTGTGEIGEPAIPMQLINLDNNSTNNLTTISDGSYRLAGAAEGTWQVTVNPGAGWRVTSQQTRQVPVSEEAPDLTDVDFCIVRVSSTVLPESGAPLAPSLIVTAGFGLLLLLLGGIMMARSLTRRES